MMTEYIATRWYRAPELILSWKSYNESIDVWSVGCILAELIRRKPLLPGKDVKHQLDVILDLVGTPSDDEMANIALKDSKEYLKSLPKRKAKDFNEYFKGANPDAIDLLRKMLTFDPSKRITVEGALKHPYMSELHFPDDEPTRGPLSLFDFDFEMYDLNAEQLKDLIFEEIQLYHSQEARDKYKANKKAHPRGMLKLKFGESACEPKGVLRKGSK